MIARLFAVVALICLLTSCTASGGDVRGGVSPEPVAAALRVEEVAGGLKHGWDIGFLPDGKALVSQRTGQLALMTDHTRPGAPVQPVRADFGDVLAQGEGGLMGLLVHPDFAANRQFITCQTNQVAGRAVDVRLVRWRLSEDGASAQRIGQPMLTGLPVNPSGRHSGCRPALAEDGALLVSTGDSARPAISQNRAVLGGKVLRMDINTGNPLPDNPFITSPNRNEQLLYTYGHRNPQGVAPRPGGQVLVAEHGPDVEDEINLLRPGGNYGWDPSRGGTEDSYDETVPMTDLERFPGAVPAVWSSGTSTEAVCAATFLTGPQWRQFDGMLAVTALKGSKLLLVGMNPDGSVRQVQAPRELNESHGRLRGARQGPDGALYLTTSNGSDDKVLRVSAT